jgi:hypothetical protein
MKKLFVLIALVFPFIVSAQQYSAQEQGLIDQIKICWDAWMEGVEKNNPDIWYEKCPAMENASFWWTDEGAPQQNDWAKRNWDYVKDQNVGWLDMRPVAIRIWDDIGMIQFYGYWEIRTKDGSIVTEFKRTEVFKKENDTWILLGGQGTPSSSRDSEPYWER